MHIIVSKSPTAVQKLLPFAVLSTLILLFNSLIILPVYQNLCPDFDPIRPFPINVPLHHWLYHCRPYPEIGAKLLTWIRVPGTRIILRIILSASGAKKWVLLHSSYKEIWNIPLASKSLDHACPSRTWKLNTEDSLSVLVHWLGADSGVRPCLLSQTLYNWLILNIVDLWQQKKEISCRSLEVLWTTWGLAQRKTFIGNGHLFPAGTERCFINWKMTVQKIMKMQFVMQTTAVWKWNYNTALSTQTYSHYWVSRFNSNSILEGR